MALVRRTGAVGPKSNVPEVSQPWARDLEARLEALEVTTNLVRRGIVTARSNTETQATFQTIQQGMIKGVQSDLIQIEIDNDLFREEVEQELEDSRERLDEAQEALDDLNENVLPGIGGRLDDMQREIDDIVVEAGGNTITYSLNMPSATSDYVEGDTWFQINGSGNILGQWEFDGTAWQSRQIESEFIANLDAGKITTGILDANRIGANSITANKLLVGDFENLFNTGPFEAQSAAGWDIEGSPSFTNWTGNSVRITPSNAVGRLYGVPLTSVRGGDEFHFSFPYQRTSTTGTISLYSRQLMSDGVATVTTRGTFTGTASNELSGTYTVPANAVAIQLYLHWTGGTSPFDMYAPLIRRRMSSTLIEDGAITTGKIEAGAITGNEIQSNSITANDAVFATGAIQSADIGDLTADKITTGTLSGIDITGVNLTGTNNIISNGSFEVRQNNQTTFRIYPDGIEVGSGNSPHVAYAFGVHTYLGDSEEEFTSLQLNRWVYENDWTTNPAENSGYTTGNGITFGALQTLEGVSTELKRFDISTGEVRANRVTLGGGVVNGALRFPSHAELASDIDAAESRALIRSPGVNTGHRGRINGFTLQDSEILTPRVFGSRSRSSDWNVPNTSGTLIPFNTWGGDFNLVTAASNGIRVQEGGLYAISANLRFVSVSGTNGVEFRVNSGTVSGGQYSLWHGTLGAGSGSTLTAHAWLLPNDLVQVYKMGTGTGTMRALSTMQVTRVST